MSTSISPSSAQLVPAFPEMLVHNRSGHLVQLYSDDSFLLEVVSQFVSGALALGDSAVVIATGTHREGLPYRLNARGVDADKVIRQGRLILLDAEEVLSKFMVNGAADEELFARFVSEVLLRARNASLNHDSRIAVFGELVALLWAEGKAGEALRLEEFWNRLAQQFSFSLLCAYPVTIFSDQRQSEPFLRMCAQHTSVASSESYMGLASPEERLRAVALLQHKSQVLDRDLNLRAAEARFQLLVEAVQDYAIFMLDPQGNIISWNNGARRIKGYASHEIIGKHFSCFYPEEDLRNCKPQRELEIAEREGRFEEEGWRIRKDGSRFWANVIITAIKNDSGKLLGFGKVTRDFTDRMEMQKALQEEVAEKRTTEARLHSSEKLLRELSLHLLRTQDEERRRIGRDLHDSLGQYLAALKIKLDMLVMSAAQSAQEANPEIAECVRLAEESIKEVRTISYLMYPPMLEETGLQSAIGWYLEGFSGRSGIKVTFEVDRDFGRLPRDSELAIFRVLQESLTNVHRHSSGDSAHVRLYAEEGMVRLTVSDNGTGIAPELLERSGPDWTGALGVGLRGMNERMRQLGGQLDVVSSKNGTTITASVPAGEAPPA